MTLARTFGQWDWRAFLKRLRKRDPHLFDEWYQLWLVDPWGPERADWQFAALASQMPDADPQELFYPVTQAAHVRAIERAELIGDPDSPAFHREQARLAAGRKKRREAGEDEPPEE